jgi:hypothetical protein
MYGPRKVINKVRSRDRRCRYLHPFMLPFTWQLVWGVLGTHAQSQTEGTRPQSDRQHLPRTRAAPVLHGLATPRLAHIACATLQRLKPLLGVPRIMR